MLVMACIWNRNSLPARLAGSPVQLSSVPKTAYFTPTCSNICTNERVTRLYRSSKEPAQPTQNKISGVSPLAANSAMVGTFINLFSDILYLDIGSWYLVSRLFQSLEIPFCFSAKYQLRLPLYFYFLYFFPRKSRYQIPTTSY